MTVGNKRLTEVEGSIQVNYKLTDPPGWSKTQEMRYDLVERRFSMYGALTGEAH